MQQAGPWVVQAKKNIVTSKRPKLSSGQGWKKGKKRKKTMKITTWDDVNEIHVLIHVSCSGIVDGAVPGGRSHQPQTGCSRNRTQKIQVQNDARTQTPAAHNEDGNSPKAPVTAVAARKKKHFHQRLLLN